MLSFMRKPISGSPCFGLLLARLTVLSTLTGTSLQLCAQEQTLTDPLHLVPSQLLQEVPSAAQRKYSPMFLLGQHISGRPDLEAVIEGNAELRKSDFSIHADRLEYYQPTDQARATGNVKINRNGNVYEGPYLELKVDAFEGMFQQPRYQFLQNNAHGQADYAHFLNENQTVVHNATSTSCRRT